MEYSNYKLDQIMDSYRNYQGVCNLFFELVSDSETKVKLENILYKGGYKDFGFCSKISSKDNPSIEIQRRVAMAYLLVRNPETFDVLVQNKVNLFHGTNANALPSILKYGLNSGLESEKQGIYVSTGEKSSRVGGRQRDFVSFTDILDIAEGYSTLNPKENNSNLSFEVVIGTTVDDVIKAGRCTVRSDVSEVGVQDKLPLDSIRVIGVPSEKVEFVKKLINNDELKVVAIDDISEKFYYVDDLGNIEILYDTFNKVKDNLRKPKNGKVFKLEEVKKLMVQWLLSKVMNLRDDKVNVVGGEKSNYEGRTR